jgi:hypothetical protein
MCAWVGEVRGEGGGIKKEKGVKKECRGPKKLIRAVSPIITPQPLIEHALVEGL